MEFIEKHKKKIIIVITVIMIIIAVFTGFYKTNATFVESGIGLIVVPIQKVLKNSENWVNDKVDFWKNIQNFEKENEELKAKIEELEIENSKLKLYESENKKLSQLLELTEKYYDYPMVGAEVVGKDPGNWYEIFTIDKGTKDGLSANMVVLTQKGLAGRITETAYNYSKVITIIDDSSSVSAKNLRTGDIGIVKGDSTLRKDGLCRMEYIDANAEIMVGDEIVTSHLGDIYPSGITIGYVKEIKADPNGLTQYALIEPVIDFKHIETVLVIDKKLEYLEEKEEE